MGFDYSKMGIDNYAPEDLENFIDSYDLMDTDFHNCRPGTLHRVNYAALGKHKTDIEVYVCLECESLLLVVKADDPTESGRIAFVITADCLIKALWESEPPKGTCTPVGPEYN